LLFAIISFDITTYNYLQLRLDIYHNEDEGRNFRLVDFEGSESLGSRLNNNNNNNNNLKFKCGRKDAIFYLKTPPVTPLQ
jgi:hypothetical protein